MTDRYSLSKNIKVTEIGKAIASAMCSTKEASMKQFRVLYKKKKKFTPIAKALSPNRTRIRDIEQEWPDDFVAFIVPDVHVSKNQGHYLVREGLDTFFETN